MDPVDNRFVSAVADQFLLSVDASVEEKTEIKAAVQHLFDPLQGSRELESYASALFRSDSCKRVFQRRDSKRYQFRYTPPRTEVLNRVFEIAFKNNAEAVIKAAEEHQKTSFYPAWKNVVHISRFTAAHAVAAIVSISMLILFTIYSASPIYLVCPLIELAGEVNSLPRVAVGLGFIGAVLIAGLDYLRLFFLDTAMPIHNYVWNCPDRLDQRHDIERKAHCKEKAILVWQAIRG